MNRQQKRQQGIKTKERVYTLKESDMSKVIMTELETIKKQATIAAIDSLMGSVLISLHDEFGLGKKRLNRFIDKLNNQYNCIEQGTVSLENFNEWAKSKGVNYKVLIDA